MISVMKVYDTAYMNDCMCMKFSVMKDYDTVYMNDCVYEDFCNERL